METIVIGGAGWQPLRRKGASTDRAVILAATAWLLVGMTGEPARADALRWRFKPGEVLHYSIEQKMVSTARGMGQERKSSRSQTTDVTWTVNAVDADGRGDVTLRYERVRMRDETPPFMPFVFDSADAKAGVQPGFEAQTQQLKAIVGTEVSFKIRPTGDIEDVRLPDATLKKLREAAPKGAAESDISEKSIKEVLLQTSPPAFPEGEVEAGKTWSSKPSRIPVGFATMVVERTFTYQGADPKAPNRLLVGIETKLTLEPVEGANVKATVRKQEGRGTMSFDVETGHLATARMTEKLDMAVTGGGQSMEEIRDTTTSMALEP